MYLLPLLLVTVADEELEGAEPCEDDDDFVYVDRPKWRTTTNWLHWVRKRRRATL